MEKGFIITLSGISGAGKSHFIKSIIEKINGIEKLKAVTTRKKRSGEVDGVDKFFISKEEFDEKNKNGEMCVVNNVFGNMYGYYNSDIEKTEKGITLITELYYKEVEKFKQEYSNVISVYILPEDINKTIKELKARNTNHEEFIRRVEDIKQEINSFRENLSTEFDIIVTNNYDAKSVDDFIEKLVLKINKLVEEKKCLKQVRKFKTLDKFKEIADNYGNSTRKKDVIYTSFDGDDMHYLHNICEYEIKRGNVPLNPETSLGYYISTVSLGGKKTDVMKDCLTLEMLANKMSVYSKEDRPLSEGIIAEMLLWDEKKHEGLDIIEGVTHLANSNLKTLTNAELKKYLAGVDTIVKYELFDRLLFDYDNEIHKSAYIIANMENFKHIDWARCYCYQNGFCPVSPQNILPLHFYEGNSKDYLESRLELLRRVDDVLLFIDRNNLAEDFNRLDPYSLAEIYFINKYLPKKQIKIVGWDEANVPKYNQNNRWSLTTNEDISVRKVLK